MLSHDYDYGSILDTSQRVNWKLEDVIEGRTFDYSRPFLPDSLAGAAQIQCLSKAERLKLNQIRGFTYLAMFGLVEEYIVPSVLDYVRTGDRANDRGVQALLHFAEEETKHIEMFKWFVREFERGFGTPCGMIGPAATIAAGILDHSPLGVFLSTLQIEWMSQMHFLESVRDTKEGLDPLVCSLLKHHWMEESQHAKLDTMVVDEIARTLTPEEIDKGIADYIDIGKMLDGGLQTQVELDLVSLEKAIGRQLNDSEKAEIREAQLKAYRWTFLLSGMTHPKFDRSLRELASGGHMRNLDLARAIA
ncbi:MAG TPA: diiron oxygenase [Thermoanaerobaculia bacterium]